MKKKIFILLILFCAFGLTACSKNNEPGAAESVVDDQLASKNSGLDNGSETKSSVKSTSQSVESLIDSSVTISNSSLLTKSTNEINQSNNTNMNNEIKTPDQQENLINEYSQVIMKTNFGDIKLKLYASESPKTVNNFLYLAKSGFYNGVKFHRVIKDFMIQGGDPLSKGSDTSIYGTGGPGYKFADEFNDHKLVAGSLAMANSGSNTNGSQFFIVTASETSWLDGKHTNFGEVVSGLDIVKKIENTETGLNDRPLSDVVINNIELLK